MANRKRVPWRVGDVVAVPLGEQMLAFGRVLEEPLMAFYDRRATHLLSLEEVVRCEVAFIVAVMGYPVESGSWPVLGNAPLDGFLQEEPLFFKKDPISGKLTIYRDSTGEEWKATKDECEKLECAAVWEPEHIVDRLNDHFAGVRNKWVESLRP